MAKGPFTRPRSPQGGDFLQEMGDPNFSPSASSQGQVPGAAAEARLNQNMQSSTNLLNDAAMQGFDVSGAEFDPIRQQAQQGVVEEKEPWILGLVEWLDGPRQAINLLIQDIVGGDAVEGFRNPNFMDYMDALAGGINDHEGFKLATGLNPQSGSHTLDMFGWEEETGLPGRIVRGVADFTLSAGIDPLTYVTFGLSALGKKAALAAGRQVQQGTVKKLMGMSTAAAKNPAYGTKLDEVLAAGVELTPYERSLAAAINDGSLVDDFSRTLERAKTNKFGGQFPRDMDEALTRHMGGGVENVDKWSPEVEAALERYFGSADEVLKGENLLEAAIANRIHDDIIRPLVARDFKNINPLARQELPLWAHGGARISVPFTQNTLTRGILIPGTVGVGKKFVGDPVRVLNRNLRKLAPGYAALGDHVKAGITKMDQMAPLLRSLGKSVDNGGIEGWQFHIAATAIDNMTNNVAKHTISTELNSQWNHIAAMAEEAGVPLPDVGVDMLIRLEGQNIDDTLKEQIQRLAGLDPNDALGVSRITTNTQLDDAIAGTVTYMQETMNSFQEALGALDPTFAEKFIKGYIPHSPTKHGRQVMLALSGTASGRTGIGDVMEDMFGQLLNAAGKGGVAEPAMGAPRHVGRSTGRVAALQYTDDGVIMLDAETLKLLNAERMAISPSGVDDWVDPSALETRYISTPQLNTILEPIIRREAALHDIALPKNWDGKVFNENPIDAMVGYVDNMGEAINAWSLIDSLKASGLAFGHQAELDMQAIVQKMYGNAVRNLQNITTPHFGRPTEGQVELAPIEWLESIANQTNLSVAYDEVISEAPMGTNYGQEFIDDIGERGVQRPVVVAVWDDGRAEILDGHHRIVGAREAGVESIPVKFRREGVLTPEGNGINIADKMKPGWFNSPGDAEDQLRRKAKSNLARSDQGSQHMKDTIRAMSMGEGAALDPKTVEKAEAIIRDFQSGAAPIGGLRRSVRSDEVRQIVDAGPGGTVDMIFESAAEGSSFAQKSRGDGWVVEFSDDTRGLRNDLSIEDEGEVFVSGRFEVVEVDEAAKTAKLQYVEDVLPEVQPSALDDMTMYDAYEVFDTLPWMPTAPKQSLIIGKERGDVPGVRRNIQTNLEKAGIPIASIEDAADARGLAKLVRTNTPDGLAEANSVSRPSLVQSVREKFSKVGRKERSMLKVSDTESHWAFGDGDRYVAATSLDTAGEVPVLRIEFAQAGTNKASRQLAKREVNKWLDEQFTKGGLAGFLNGSGIRALQEQGLDKATALQLDEYLRRKLGSLPPETREWMSGEAAEIFEMRTLWTDFFDGFASMVAGTSAARTADGNLVADPERLRLMGSVEDVEKLRDLQQVARRLGDNGYDAAVQIMAGTDLYTGVSKIANYTNPAKFNLAGPAIDDLTIQEDIAEWLSLVASNMGSIYTPEGIAAAKMAAKNALRIWRASATLPRPAFHIRNLIGGSWMNMQFGVTSKTMMRVNKNGITFRNALKNAKGTDSLETAFKALPAADQKAWRAAWENGVLAGFATTEFSGALNPRGMHERFDWAKAWDVDNFALTRAGGKVMESVEDFMRMSLFMQHYDEAVEGSARTAASIVNAVHFDYSNLTPTETKLKSWIPFFVWTRRNLPLQIQMAVENPRTVQRYMHMMNAMSDNFGGEDPANLQEADHFSAYAAGTNYRVNPESPFWARVMIDPDLPISDLLSIPNPNPADIMEFANGLLGPHVSSLVDINAQRDFGDVNAPAPFNSVLQGLAAVGFYDRTEAGDVRIPYFMRTLMETIVPWSREIVDPITGGPTDPNRQQRLGITEDDDYLSSTAKSAGAQILGGLGIKFTTPADARGATYRSQAEVDKLIKELRLEGKLPQVEQ